MKNDKISLILYFLLVIFSIKIDETEASSRLLLMGEFMESQIPKTYINSLKRTYSYTPATDLPAPKRCVNKDFIRYFFPKKVEFIDEIHEFYKPLFIEKHNKNALESSSKKENKRTVVVNLSNE